MRGDPAPWFTGTTLSRPDFAFEPSPGVAWRCASSARRPTPRCRPAKTGRFIKPSIRISIASCRRAA